MIYKSPFHVLIFALFLVPSTLQAGIEVGSAAIEITPSESLRMAGYSARKEPSKGIMDPLYVRTMILRKDERSIGFVVYDLIGTLGKKINQELATDIKKRTGLDEVLFIAIHTHAAPALQIADNVASLPSYESQVYAKTMEAVQDAWHDLEPARLGAGRGSVDLNYNRIRKLPDNRVQMVWENPEKEPLGPTEQDVYILRVDNLEGKTKLILVNYACHPVILGSDNLLYSPDFPGAMCRTVETSHPDGPRCIFINGACGDMNPYFADENDRPAERVREVGGELANEVLRVAASIETKKDDSPLSVTWRRSDYLARGRWDLEELARGKDSQEIAKRLSKRTSELQLPVSVVLLTPEIGFVGLPGEFFSSFQRALRRQSPIKNLFVAGYTDAAFGYFPDIKAAAVGGYGANDTATYVAVGTGEHIVIEALVSLNRLIGELRPVPSTSRTGYRQ